MKGLIFFLITIIFLTLTGCADKTENESGERVKSSGTRMSEIKDDPLGRIGRKTEFEQNRNGHYHSPGTIMRKVKSGIR